MKKITLLLILLTVSFGYSQELVTNGDFQTGVGAPWYNGGLNVVDLGGGTWVNQVEVTVAGNPWDVNISQDILLDNGKTYELSYEAWTDATTASRTMIAGLGQNGPGWASLSANPALTATPTIFTHQFTINYGDGVADRVFFDMGAQTGFVFIDNVSVVEVVNTCANDVQDGDEEGVDCGGSCPTPCPSPPSTAAPTPPARAAGDVISLYSGQYSNVASTFDAGWCGANSVEEIMVDGNPTQRYLGNACQGIVLDAGVDASTFTKLHVDFFIEAGTDLVGKVFNLKFVNQPGGAAVEVNLNTGTTPALVAGSWVQVDVDVDLSSQTGFKEFGITSNLNNVVYYDNLYAHKGTTLGVNEFDTANFSVYPNPSNNVWNIKGQETINKVQVHDVLGKQVMTLTPKTNEVSIEASTLPKGLYFAKMTTDLGSGSIKLIKN